MNNLFVPYKQSVALELLGFNEETLAFYIKGPNNTILLSYKDLNTIEDTLIRKTKAPLFQQTLKFFREKYRTNTYIQRDLYSNLFYFTLEYRKGKTKNASLIQLCNNNSYNSYEEAELALIDKLIEIFKN